MTKPPTTIAGIEALEYARAFILRLHKSGGEVDSPFGAAESRLLFRKILHMMTLTVDGRLLLVELARAGEDDADAVVRTLILEFQSRGQVLPVELSGFAMDLVRGAGRVSPPAGPLPKDKFLRNLCIAFTVAAVCDRFGLKATGHSVRRRSGCAVVGQALGVINMTMSPKAVEEIWRLCGRAMPTTPGWVAALER